MSSSITLRFIAGPGRLDLQGKVSAGQVMQWIDEASFARATHWSGNPCVAVFVGSIRFLRPIHVGQIVEVDARLVYTGDTSINMAVEVRSADVEGGAFHKTTECLTVFVALDEDGRPLPVKSWSPSTPGEIALAENTRAYLDAARAPQTYATPENGPETAIES